MKQFILLLVLIAFVLPVVNAVPDSVVTGPYKVSFDLGLKSDEYTVKISPQKQTEELDGTELNKYVIFIVLNTPSIDEISKLSREDFASAYPNLLYSGKFRFAFIEIDEFKKAQPVLTFEGFNFASIANPNFSVSEASNRMIDGIQGAVLSIDLLIDSLPIKAYVATYQAPFDPGYVKIDIGSLFPWDEGTLQLLKSIHVEKIL